MPNDFVRLEEAASELGCHTATIRRRIQRYKIFHLRQRDPRGGFPRIYVRVDDVRPYLNMPRVYNAPEGKVQHG